MSVRSRAIVVLIAALAMGVLIGTLVVGPTVARRHFRHVDEDRSREGFASRLEKILKPDSSQAGPMREILTKYSAQFEKIETEYHASMRALGDSLRKDLDPILTAEQRARLERDRSHRGPTRGRR
jgi:hypothetical protein